VAVSPDVFIASVARIFAAHLGRSDRQPCADDLQRSRRFCHRGRVFAGRTSATTEISAPGRAPAEPSRDSRLFRRDRQDLGLQSGIPWHRALRSPDGRMIARRRSIQALQVFDRVRFAGGGTQGTGAEVDARMARWSPGRSGQRVLGYLRLERAFHAGGTTVL
jgi:hypothetical protein